MEYAVAVAQAVGKQQDDGTGHDRDRDRQREQRWLVVHLSIGAHGGHAHVMHGADTQADADGSLHVPPGM
ncbi:hypothetical protein D3C80_1036630 [compost metagenome]